MNRRKETLERIHIIISSAKSLLLSNYDDIKGKYLQLFLNDFVYNSTEDISVKTSPIGR